MNPIKKILSGFVVIFLAQFFACSGLYWLAVIYFAIGVVGQIIIIHLINEHQNVLDRIKKDNPKYYDRYVKGVYDK